MIKYHPIESYKKAIEILDAVTKIILFSFANHGTEVKEIIIRNFIARAIVALKGIFKLYEMDNHHDCWVLHSVSVQLNSDHS